jgi:hypothetical protein
MMYPSHLLFNVIQSYIYIYIYVAFQDCGTFELVVFSKSLVGPVFFGFCSLKYL